MKLGLRWGVLAAAALAACGGAPQRGAPPRTPDDARTPRADVPHDDATRGGSDLPGGGRGGEHHPQKH